MLYCKLRRVYRDKGRWSTAVEFQGRLYFLGKYDTEDDALAIYRKYASEIEQTGSFTVRKVRKIGGNFQSASDLYATPLSQSNIPTASQESVELDENAEAQQPPHPEADMLPIDPKLVFSAVVNLS